MKRLSLLAIAGSVLAVTAFVTAAVPDPVRLDSGMLSGTTGSSGDVRIFRGVPYAAPPVGALRWKAPQPVAKWEGVRAANEYGARCMQGGAGGGGDERAAGGQGGGRRGAAPGDQPAAAGRDGARPRGRAEAGAGWHRRPAADERRLPFLNVWTPARSASDRLPVMVWIHGAGLTGGSGSEPRYDGEELSKKGAVVITINYRLGPFGWLAHPELTKESGQKASGNYGVMDAIAALQVGAEERRRVRRRHAARHDLRRVGRRLPDFGAGRIAGSQGPVRARHRRKRRLDGHGHGHDEDAGASRRGGRQSRDGDERQLDRRSAHETGGRHSARPARRRTDHRRQVHPRRSVGHLRARQTERRRHAGRLQQGRRHVLRTSDVDRRAVHDPVEAALRRARRRLPEAVSRRARMPKRSLRRWRRSGTKPTGTCASGPKPRRRSTRRRISISSRASRRRRRARPAEAPRTRRRLPTCSVTPVRSPQATDVDRKLEDAMADLLGELRRHRRSERQGACRPGRW